MKFRVTFHYEPRPYVIDADNSALAELWAQEMERMLADGLRNASISRHSIEVVS